MPVHQTGRIAEDVYILGHPSVPMFLFDGDEPTLIDAGLDRMAPRYRAEVERILDGRPPARILLTHSHFDHVGSVGALVEAWPEMQICASARAAEVLAKPHVMASIIDLNQSAGDFISRHWFDLPPAGPLVPFEVDQVLSDGDYVPVGDHSGLQVKAAPGHTRDFLAYYSPDKRILVGSEALGTIMFGTNYIVTECLVGYEMYLASMRRLEALPVETILLGHHYHLVGNEARGHIDRSIGQSEAFRARVEALLTLTGGDLDQVMKRIKVEEWDPRPWPKQDLQAYLINLQARVAAIRDLNPAKEK